MLIKKNVVWQILPLLVLFQGCMTSMDVGSMTEIHHPMESVKAKDVELFFTELPDEKDAVVIGRLDLIGNTYAQMKAGVRKQAGKAGADAAVVMAQTEGSSDYFSLGYKMSENYLGSKGNKSYYLVNYQAPRNSSVGYVRWLVYAVSYRTDAVETSSRQKTLFDFDKAGLFEATRRKLAAEKKLEAEGISDEKKEELENEIKAAQSDLDRLGFDELGDFEQEAVLLRGARLAGVQVADTSPEGQARMKKMKALLTTASVLSYM